MAVNTPDYQKGLTFEQVWAMFQETDRKMQETDREMKETGRYIRELGRQMGDLHNTFGEIAEHLVAPGIAERFNELGYRFDAVSPGGHRILDDKGKIKTEIETYWHR